MQSQYQNSSATRERYPAADPGYPIADPSPAKPQTNQNSAPYPPALCPFTKSACLRDFCAWFVRDRVAEPDKGQCALTVCAKELRGIKFNLNP